jgi:hypothetical protein
LASKPCSVTDANTRQQLVKGPRKNSNIWTKIVSTVTTVYVKIRTSTCFFNFQNASLMRRYLCHFPSGTLREHIGETIFIGEMSTKFLCGSPCFLLVERLNP